MARFRFALRFPAGFPSYNLSVTCGDTSPCRRGFGIAQTSPPRQRLPYQGSWHREAMTERLYYMARFRFCFTVFRQAFLRTTSPSPAVTPLLVGEALAFRKLHLFAKGSPTRGAGGRKPD